MIPRGQNQAFGVGGVPVQGLEEFLTTHALHVAIVDDHVERRFRRESRDPFIRAADDHEVEIRIQLTLDLQQWGDAIPDAQDSNTLRGVLEVRGGYRQGRRG